MQSFEVLVVDLAELIVLHEVLHESKGDGRRSVAEKSCDDEVHALHVSNGAEVFVSEYSQDLFKLDSSLLALIKVRIVELRSIDVLLDLAQIVSPSFSSLKFSLLALLFFLRVDSLAFESCSHLLWLL